MLGYIFLLFLCNFSLMFYNRCLLHVCHHSFKGPSFSNKATMPRQQVGFQLSALSRPFCILLTALLYYSLEFCNRQLLQIFPSLLSVTVALNAIVVLSATILRLLWVTQMTDKRRNFPDWSHYLKNELPVVIAWALDIVCSISYLVYIILLSLSTMTTFIRITTITVFAIVFALKQWYDIPQTLVGIFTLFTRWLLLYTFESRESNAEELVLAVFVIGLSGLRWTLTQKHESAEQALKEIQKLKDENDRVKREKCQGKRERLDLLAHKKNVEKELRDTRQRNIKLFVQNKCLQRDSIATEALVKKLKTQHTRLMVQKHRLEKEKNDVQNEKDQLVVENNSLTTVLIEKESQLHEQQEEMQQLESEKNRLSNEKYQKEKRESDMQPKFLEISVQNSMDRFGPTGKDSKKPCNLLRCSSFPRTKDRLEFWLNGSRPV